MRIKNLKMNKKIVSMLLTGTILLSQVPAYADMYIKNDIITSNDTVNLRYDTSTKSTRLGKLGKNVEVKRLLVTDDGWDLIEVKGKLAFVMHEFMNDNDETIYGNNVEYRTQLITTEGVNMRINPNIDSSVVGSVGANKKVDILALVNDDWYLVQNNDTLGFCNKEYFREIKEEDLYIESEFHYIGNTQDLFVPCVKATKQVNVRINSSKDSERIGELVTNQKVEYTGVIKGDFYQIIYQNQLAYVHKDYVKLDSMLNMYYGNVIGTVYAPKDINLRTSPDMGNNIQGTIDKNTVMEILEDHGDFYLIKTADYLGYVSKSVVKKTDSLFISIDKSHQELRLYQDGRVIFCAPVTTGSDSNYTDEGVFSINLIKYDTYLVGDNYRTHVDVFMRYNGGEGIHDLIEKIYQYGSLAYYHEKGSHGCDRMRHDDALKLASLISKGTQVIVHSGRGCNGKVVDVNYVNNLSSKNNYIGYNNYMARYNNQTNMHVTGNRSRRV